MLTKTKERPILFSGPMVRAILEGRKTQTRRVVNHQSYFPANRQTWPLDANGLGAPGAISCPYGNPGQRLWVRETWQPGPDDSVAYRASDDMNHNQWKPSIFMPRWASRITLEVTDVRVERVQAISRLDIVAEGWPHDERQALQIAQVIAGLDDEVIDDASIEWFADLWDSINAKRGYSWESNPWVWVITFIPTPSAADAAED